MASSYAYHCSTRDLGGSALDAVARLARSARTPYVVYEADGCWTYAADPAVEIVARADGRFVLYDHLGRRMSSASGPLPRALGDLLAEIPVAGWRACGWAAFELAGLSPERQGTPAEEPLLHLMVPRVEVRLEGRRARIRSLDPESGRRAAEVLGAGDDAPPDLRPWATVDVATASDERYRDEVARAVRHIRDGALEKVVLSRRVPLSEDIDMVATFVNGRRHNTPRRSFLLDLGDRRAAGFSPETVVEVDAAGGVVSRPLAGTRALGGGPEEDERRRADLRTDPKEVYEHAISVRVAVEELGRLCRPGEVRVEPFMTVEGRGSVQHLASRVAGRLRPGVGCWDAFAALFPGVTVSGVPKAAACRYIGDREPGPRGIYGGAVLAVDQDGTLDAAVALRTVFADARGAWLRAGAGVVGQSRPERELAETAEKLASVAPYLVRESGPPVAAAGSRPAADRSGDR